MMVAATFPTAQIHRINGARAQAGKRGRGKAGELQAGLLALLAQEPMHGAEIRQALEVTYTRSNNLLATMLIRDEIVVIGTTEQAGKIGVRRDAKMYALPGTPLLPDIEKPEIHSEHPKGQPAGRPYHRGLAGWGGFGNAR